MVSIKALLISVAAVVLCAPADVDAHGYMSVPAAKLASSGDPTKYATTIYGPTVLPPPAGMKYADTVANNLKAFTTAFNSAGYSSLASFIKKKAPSAGACGTTSLDPSRPETVGDYVQWSSFAASHVGPCEVWCGSKRVFHNDNCAGAYKSTPARLPITKSKCSGAKQLVFYWLALHEPNWQVYINCASLTGQETRSIDDDEEESEQAATQASTDIEERANDADCDEDLLEPDCDDNLPEPDSDDDLPEPDCDDDLPEPSDDAAGDADDCDENLPEPDCDEDLPEPDCDEDLPEPDCDENLPEPTVYKSASRSAYDFDDLDGNQTYSPGKAEAEPVESDDF